MKMRKTIMLVLLTFMLCNVYAQTWPIRVEAENYNTQSGTYVLPCAEGGQCVSQVNGNDWVEYQINLPKDSVYIVSVRIAGRPGQVWVTDSVFNVLGKIYVAPTLSDQTYQTVSVPMFLKGGNRKIRFQFKQAGVNVNWVELTPSAGLYSANYFDSDWEFMGTGVGGWGAVAYKACRADSASGWIKQTARTQSLMLSNNHPYSGSSSAKFELAKADSCCWPYLRSEIYRGPAPVAEMWYGFASMSTTSITGDALPHIIFQLHGTDDPARDGNPAEAKSPNCALRIENDSMYVKVLWCAAAYSSDVTKDGETVYSVGKYVPGQWDRWVFHIKYSYGNTGVLEVWRNGNKLVNRINLPNAYNDIYRSYPKFGIYKWGWVNPWFSYSPYDVLTVYMDNIKIGGATSNFTEVNP